MAEDLTYIAAIALMPLLPAFLLYKFLPSGQTKVKGPFRGLTIQLTGAFGGYFLVVLIITSVVIFLIRRRPLPPPPPAYQYEVYTVKGTIDLKSGAPSSTRLEPSDFILSLRPPERTVAPDGSFSFEIPVKRGQIGEPEFPDLLISHPDPNHEPATVHLDENYPSPQPYKVTYNKEAKRIDISPTIILTAHPPYSPDITATPYNPSAEKKP